MPRRKANENIKSNIEELDKSDIYNLMLVLLYMSSDNPKYGAINELAYILDHDSFIKFMKYYEGQTIQIPTLDETRIALRMLLMFQYYKVEGLGWHESLQKAGFSQEDSCSVRRRMIKFLDGLNKYEYKLGGLLNDNK